MRFSHQGDYTIVLWDDAIELASADGLYKWKFQGEFPTIDDRRTDPELPIDPPLLLPVPTTKCEAFSARSATIGWTFDNGH